MKTFATCLSTLLLIPLLGCPAQPSAGQGIFQQQMENHKYQDPSHPLLSGSIFQLYWAEIEPERGTYRWQVLDENPLVVATRARGKRLTVKLQFQGKQGRPALPSWLDVPIVEGTNGEGEYASWPVFWDETFQSEFDRFLSALAGRYDGDSSIEFFWYEETACGYPRATDAWIQAGFTDVEVYLNARIALCETYRKHFRKTPLLQMINKFRESSKSWLEEHPEDADAMRRFADYLADNGIYLGTPDFYASEEEADYGDRAMIWPIFREHAGKTKIVVLVDRPHAKDIADPSRAVDTLFASYPVDYLFVDPKLLEQEEWVEALEAASARLGTRR